MTVGLELGATSPSILWRSPGTHQALALHGDDVWFWTFASPQERWAGVAGTFRVAATPAEKAALDHGAERVVLEFVEPLAGGSPVGMERGEKA